MAGPPQPGEPFHGRRLRTATGLLRSPAPATASPTGARRSRRSSSSLDPLSSATNHNSGASTRGFGSGKLYVAVGDESRSARERPCRSRTGTGGEGPASSTRTAPIPSDNPTSFAGITQVPPAAAIAAIWAVGLQETVQLRVREPGTNAMFVDDALRRRTPWEEIERRAAARLSGWHRDGRTLTTRRTSRTQRRARSSSPPIDPANPGHLRGLRDHRRHRLQPSTPQFPATAAGVSSSPTS